MQWTVAIAIVLAGCAATPGQEPAGTSPSGGLSQETSSPETHVAGTSPDATSTSQPGPTGNATPPWASGGQGYGALLATQEATLNFTVAEGHIGWAVVASYSPAGWSLAELTLVLPNGTQGSFPAQCTTVPPGVCSLVFSGNDTPPAGNWSAKVRLEAGVAIGTRIDWCMAGAGKAPEAVACQELGE